VSSDLASRPLVVIGNPENRRVTLFLGAARRLNLPPPQVIGYDRLLAEPASGDWKSLVPAAAIVRIESPGENAAVEQALIRRGGRLLQLDPGQIEAVAAAAAERGRIAGSALWYAGYRDLLAEIEAALRPREVRWMNHPAEIPLLFDKSRCQSLLSSRGISVPDALPLDGRSPSCTAELFAELDRAGWPRVFVKLRYGSSASGVVALARSRSRMQATTSVELATEGGQTKLFNSLRVHRYTDPAQIASILDELCRQHVHVERWVPKAGLAGRTFDLRVVSIAGQPRHLVMRTSAGPITNLHLGNQRGDVAALWARWPPAARESAWAACRAAAACFPRSLYCGIDLALLPGLRRHAILEVNAFGDLLPGIVDAHGDDTYSAELKALLQAGEVEERGPER
jgi:hypothetical protein